MSDSRSQTGGTCALLLCTQSHSCFIHCYSLVLPVYPKYRPGHPEHYLFSLYKKCFLDQRIQTVYFIRNLKKEVQLFILFDTLMQHVCSNTNRSYDTAIANIVILKSALFRSNVCLILFLIPKRHCCCCVQQRFFFQTKIKYCLDTFIQKNFF